MRRDYLMEFGHTFERMRDDVKKTDPGLDFGYNFGPSLDRAYLEELEEAHNLHFPKAMKDLYAQMNGFVVKPSWDENGFGMAEINTVLNPDHRANTAVRQRYAEWQSGWAVAEGLAEAGAQGTTPDQTFGPENPFRMLMFYPDAFDEHMLIRIDPLHPALNYEIWYHRDRRFTKVLDNFQDFVDALLKRHFYFIDDVRDLVVEV